jgi:hypothetical protein
MPLTIASFSGTIYCLIAGSGCFFLLLLGEAVENFGLAVGFSAVNHCQKGIKRQ